MTMTILESPMILATKVKQKEQILLLSPVVCPSSTVLPLCLSPPPLQTPLLRYSLSLSPSSLDTPLKNGAIVASYSIVDYAIVYAIVDKKNGTIVALYSIVDYAIVDAIYVVNDLIVRVDMARTRGVSSARTRGALEDMHHVTPGPGGAFDLMSYVFVYLEGCCLGLLLEVIWMPYTEATIIAYSPACREASYLWLAQIPFHYFDIIELYFLDRVMRQFGLSQHIPNYVDTGDELHDISRQGRREENWLLIHAAYLDMWHDMRDHIFVEWHLTVDLQSCMRWYMSITR
ncbi:hypothetical protein Acr_21g0004400 [Actinidia rufa]|uniref:Aminotransferase-like plant mobile domain-containing protein n=1 Tax=Actinidia rufa TaxID=165716 RepID=A0A7J0GGI7_9ERIC|nr:hypothetical protein Acr_21g0004400 [Actinidia rufa]